MAISSHLSHNPIWQQRVLLTSLTYVVPLAFEVISTVGLTYKNRDEIKARFKEVRSDLSLTPRKGESIGSARLRVAKTALQVTTFALVTLGIIVVVAKAMPLISAVYIGVVTGLVAWKTFQDPKWFLKSIKGSVDSVKAFCSKKPQETSRDYRIRMAKAIAFVIVATGLIALSCYGFNALFIKQFFVAHVAWSELNPSFTTSNFMLMIYFLMDIALIAQTVQSAWNREWGQFAFNFVNTLIGVATLYMLSLPAPVPSNFV